MRSVLEAWGDGSKRWVIALALCAGALLAYRARADDCNADTEQLTLELVSLEALEAADTERIAREKLDLSASPHVAGGLTDAQDYRETIHWEFGSTQLSFEKEKMR